MAVPALTSTRDDQLQMPKVNRKAVVIDMGLSRREQCSAAVEELAELGLLTKPDQHYCDDVGRVRSALRRVASGDNEVKLETLQRLNELALVIPRWPCWRERFRYLDAFFVKSGWLAVLHD